MTYNLTYLWNLKKKKKNLIHVENRLVVLRGWSRGWVK